MPRTRAAILLNEEQAGREREEKSLRLPGPDKVERCSYCGNPIGSHVYAGRYLGAIRYPWLCSKCAAKWVELGGSIVLRLVR